MKNEIFPKFGDATTYPLKNYDALFVTGSCSPKKEIFNHIFDETEKSKIILRNPHGLYNLWYSSPSPQDICKFNIVENVDHSEDYPFDSLLLAKDGALNYDQ